MVINSNIENDPILNIWRDNASSNKEKLNRSNTRSLQWIRNNNFTRGFPIALVGAGPSLNSSIDFIKRNNDSLYIISSDAAMPHLRINGVIPDLVVSIDPSEYVIKFYSDYLHKDTIICCPITASPALLDISDARYFLFCQSDSRSKIKNDVLVDIKNLYGKSLPDINNNFFVGATMLQIADMLYPSNIYLFGYDFSYNGGSTYCNGTAISKWGYSYKENLGISIDALHAAGKLFDLDGSPTSYIKAKSGLCTTNLFMLYLSVFNTLIRGRLNIINASVDLGTNFIPYTILEDFNEKTNKPNLWNLYPRKRHR